VGHVWSGGLTMQKKFHIENINHPVGSTHNSIVYYATVENVIRYYLPKMPAGQYTIHELDSINIYRRPIRSTPTYRRAA
jgi:hypothetical protein